MTTRLDRAKNGRRRLAGDLREGRAVNRAAGASCPVLDESFPVRYHFENATALHRHLAAGPFFIPDLKLPGERGSRVIVEIDFPGAVEQSLVRGRLAKRQRDGVWLDLAPAHPTAWWDPGA